MRETLGHSQEAAKSGDFQDAVASLTLILVLTASLALNVRLGLKLKSLERAVAGELHVGKLPTGTIVPSIGATDLGGKQTAITYAGYPPTVLYVFVPPCGWCARNLANIQALARARGKTYRFIGLSLTATGLKEYGAANNMDFPVYTQVSPEAISALGLGGTPQTFVVSSEGKLLRNWTGAYGGNLQAEIEQYFGAQLPGLTQ